MVQVYRNARVWDGISDQYAEVDAVCVANGVITALGAGADLDGADAAAVHGSDSIDCQGLTLIPGLIDAHVHMVLNPEERDPIAHTLLSEDESMAAMAVRARAMLAAGITTARDLGGGRWLELRLRQQIAEGAVHGPRLVCSGQPITSPGGHCHFWGGEAPSTAAALEVLARQLEHDVDLIKIMATGGSITPGSKPIDAQFDQETVTAVVQAAQAAGKAVAAHCHGTAGIRHAANAGVTTIEHCSWVGPTGWGTDFDPAAVATMARQGVWVSPTVNAGWQRYLDAAQKRKDEGKPVDPTGGFLGKMRYAYQQLQAAGVGLIASTDAGIPNVFHHHLPRALAVFQQIAELTPVATLRAATSDCASALGLADSVGQIAVGMSADFLLVRGDPLNDLSVLSNLDMVVARGERSALVA